MELGTDRHRWVNRPFPCSRVGRSSCGLVGRYGFSHRWAFPAWPGRGDRAAWSTDCSHPRRRWPGSIVCRADRAGKAGSSAERRIDGVALSVCTWRQSWWDNALGLTSTGWPPKYRSISKCITRPPVLCASSCSAVWFVVGWSSCCLVSRISSPNQITYSCRVAQAKGEINTLSTHTHSLYGHWINWTQAPYPNPLLEQGECGHAGKLRVGSRPAGRQEDSTIVRYLLRGAQNAVVLAAAPVKAGLQQVYRLHQWLGVAEGNRFGYACAEEGTKKHT